MSDNLDLPEEALTLRKELLLLLLNLRYKKNSICSLSKFRRNLSNKFIAGLVVFSFLFLVIANSVSFSLGQNPGFPVILDRMKNEFLPTLDWSACRLEDIRSWLPDFSELPPSQELVLIEFNICTCGDLIANFDNSRISLAHHDSEVVPTSLSSEVIIPKDSELLPPVSTCSTWSKAAKDKRVGNMADTPKVLVSSPSSVAMAVANVFSKNEHTVPNKIAKILKIFDRLETPKSRWVIPWH